MATDDEIVRLVVDATDALSPTSYITLPGRPPQRLRYDVAVMVKAAFDDSDDWDSLITNYPKSAERIDAVLDGRQLIISEVPRAPHLKRMQIEVGLRCNLGCVYCYSVSGIYNREQIGANDVIDLIDQGSEMGIISLDLTGGELLLNPDWKSFVVRARSYGISTTIHTNGTLLSASTVAFLKQQGVTAVQVSLDSHIAEVNDRNRRGRGAFKRAMRGLQLLADSGIPTRISLMASRSNKLTLGDTINFVCKNFPAAEVHVDRVIETGSAQDYSGEWLEPVEYWDLMRPYLGEQVSASKTCESVDTRDFEPDCGVAYSFVYVTASGQIAACPTMTIRENADLFASPFIGDATLSAAWYDSAFFNSFRFTNCRNVTTCPAGTHCGGGCRSNAYADTGEIDSPDVIACNINKNRGAVFLGIPEISPSSAL